MGLFVFDILNEYNNIFGHKPKVVVPADNKSEYIVKPSIKKGEPLADTEVLPIVRITNNADKVMLSTKGGVLQEEYFGVPIWLPTTLMFDDGTSFYLPYNAISVSGQKQIVRTSLAERKGSVKELWNLDDYKFTIKGFFIDKQNRTLPEKDLQQLKEFYESTKRCFLKNALADFILSEDDAVVITSFNLVEVEGGKKSMRPFIMTLESDSIFELEVE